MYIFLVYIRAVPGGISHNWGRPFLKINYIDITKNFCKRICKFTEMITREKCDLPAVLRTFNITCIPYAVEYDLEPTAKPRPTQANSRYVKCLLPAVLMRAVLVFLSYLVFTPLRY